MTNEQYLIISYFAMAGGAGLLSLLTWLILRRPLQELSGSSGRGSFIRLVRRLFPVVLFLMGLSGFASVGYFGVCDHDTYAEIVADRAWMEHKTVEQASAIMNYLIIALFAWGFAMVAILIAIERERGRQAMEEKQQS